MFKKAIEAKSHQRLSGADKKKLRRNVKDKFSNASDSDIDSLLPPKAEITVAKFQNRALVYAVEGDGGGLPLFLDVDGRGSDIYPTVYALWKIPHLLPCFTLKGGEVSRYIVGGADLMFPGISIPSEGLPSFSSGESWAVKVPGNPAPIAVGTTLMSSNEAFRAGLRGKALRIIHYYRDFLWGAAEGRFVPNAGFLEDAVFPDPSFSSLADIGDMESQEQLGDVGHHDSATDPDPNVPGNAHETGEPQCSYINGDNSHLSAEVVAKMSQLHVTESMSHEESIIEGQQPLSTEDVDVLLDKCLLQALHTTVKDKDLPLPGSTLWSNHVLVCRPPGITLDIKKSSFKKLSKWLLSKTSGGLISAKEDKHKKEVVLIAVNRSHPDYTSFKPEKKPVAKIDQTGDQVIGVEQNQRLLDLEEVYKPTSHVNPIFSSVGADTTGIYSASEAIDIVFKYVEKGNLVKPTDKSVVVLDPTLCDALFKGAIKKGSAYPTEIHKKDLGSTFLNRMQAHHKVTRGNECVVKKGGIKTVQILTERRQGNKKVTKVSGIETFLIDGESLASELQKKFACSTTVSELPGKKGQEVLIQGGVIDHLARYLIEQYGIPKKYIEVLDKTRR